MAASIAEDGTKVKAYLVKGEKVKFYGTQSSLFGSTNVQEHTEIVKIRKELITPCQAQDAGNVEEANLCIMLKELLFSKILSYHGTGHPGSDSFIPRNEWDLDIVFTLVKIDQSVPEILVTVRGQVLEDLVFLFGNEDVTLKLILFGAETESGNKRLRVEDENNSPDFQADLSPQISDDLTVFVGSNKRGELKWTADQYKAAKERDQPLQFSANLSIVLTTKEGNCADSLIVKKKLLRENYKKDIKIVAENGRMIPCHKIVFTSHNDCLKNMIEEELENNTNIMSLSDVTEDAIRALLAYLYYGDLEGSSLNCSLASKLLVTAIKYQVRELEGSLKKILVDTPPVFFTLEAAFDVYLIARGHSGDAEWNELKGKSISILKLKRQEMMTFQKYKALDPTSARELCETLLLSS